MNTEPTTTTALLALLDCYCGFAARGYPDAPVFLAAAVLIALRVPDALHVARLARAAFEREREFHGDEAQWLTALATVLGG